MTGTEGEQRKGEESLVSLEGRPFRFCESHFLREHTRAPTSLLPLHHMRTQTQLSSALFFLRKKGRPGRAETHPRVITPISSRPFPLSRFSSAFGCHGDALAGISPLDWSHSSYNLTFLVRNTWTLKPVRGNPACAARRADDWIALAQLRVNARSHGPFSSPCHVSGVADVKACC